MNTYLITLQHAVQALAENTPAARLAIYARTREVALRKLESFEPRRDAVIERQMQNLENAIAEVEHQFADKTKSSTK